MEKFLDIALIISSIATVVCVVLQNRGSGLGSLAGGEPGAIFSARRGIEKILFYLTIAFSSLLVVLVLIRIIAF
jgi:preprotein translocase subunit SecG